MKILVTGIKGQLGYDIVKLLNEKSIECVGVDIDDFDLTSEKDVRNYILNYSPTSVIHCAAYTAVDKAEDNKEICYNVNVSGVSHISKVCAEIGASLMYFSTDYIFDGKKDSSFEIYDAPNPINYYGYTKYQGELKVMEALKNYFILRISWVFGLNGNNFIKTMLKLSSEKEHIDVVNDQIGSPTYTRDLANLVIDMIQTKKYGIYHASNENFCSWYDFACEIFKESNINIAVNPITSDKFITKAKRPFNSRLSKKSLTENGFSLLPTWQDAVKRYLEESKRS